MKPETRQPIGKRRVLRAHGGTGGLYPVGERDERMVERCRLVGGREMS